MKIESAPETGNIDFDNWVSKLVRMFNDDPTEFDETAAGAGTDGTISSRSANALGECDGFLKFYKSDGTLVYVPYWEDITP